ncbi:MAG: peptidoglycan DD-metalloendopeptidase family protein [Clostridia bacterium]|nr:peptidoglycan DD-metalloendopeptidase family protein [Clostridia bacterium]
MQAEGSKRVRKPLTDFYRTASDTLRSASRTALGVVTAAAAEVRAVDKKVAAFITAAVVAVSASSTAAAVYTLGFDVYYNGANIGTISNMAEYEAAVASANATLLSLGAPAIGEDIQCFLRIAPRNEITPDPDLARAFVMSSENVREGYTLYADGEAIYTTATIEECEGALGDFAAKYTNESVAYSAQISFVNEACLAEDIMTRTQALDVLCVSDAVKVIYSMPTYTETVIPFDTDYIDDDTLYMGVEKIESAGVEGKAVTTTWVNYENGAVVDSSEGETQVLSQPITAIVRRGTKLGVSEGRGYPADGVITSRFGSRWGRQHKGIDIGADTGTPVYSYTDGTVIMAEYYYGYGNYIKVDHGNGFVTAYAHLSKMAVSVGDTVKGGEYIGAVGNTGSSTGSHLHFEVIIDGSHVDPEPYISK